MSLRSPRYLCPHCRAAFPLAVASPAPTMWMDCPVCATPGMKLLHTPAATTVAVQPALLRAAGSVKSA